MRQCSSRERKLCPRGECYVLFVVPIYAVLPRCFLGGGLGGFALNNRAQGAQVKGTIECEAARINGTFDGEFMTSQSLHVSAALVVLFVRM